MSLMERLYQMKKNNCMKGIFLSGCLAVILAGSVKTQQTITRLTFKEAVKIGLANNVSLNQQENLLVSSQASKSAALFNMAPSVNIIGNAGRNDGNSFNQQQGKVVNGVVDFIGANISANMPLFNGMNNVNQYRQSVQQTESQLHFVKRTNQDVITNIANQFLMCLLDQQLVFIREKNLETQQQQYNQIKEMVAAGSRAEVELLKQDYQVKNAEVLVLRAKAAFRNNKAILAQTLQIDPFMQFELAEPKWDVNHNDLELMTLENMYTAAVEQRSDLQQANADEKAAGYRYMASKGTYFPDIGLFLQYGSRYNYIHPSEGFDPENRSFQDQFGSDNIQLAYGIAFTIPVFRGFQTRSQVVQNRMLLENAKLSKHNAEITVKADVLRAFQNYQDARTNFEASASQLKSAEVAYLLEKERYDLGISDIVTLSLSIQDYTSAQADYAGSKYTLMFQRILINYANGTLKFEDIP